MENNAIMFDGKQVYTEWDNERIRIGDYVTQDVVDDFMDCLPPACYSSRCSQMGEPYSCREDPNTGKFRNTYMTFSRVSGQIWKYCGNCFQGETEERGVDPPYIR